MLHAPAIRLDRMRPKNRGDADPVIVAPATSVVPISHLATRVPPCDIAETRYVPSGHDGYSEAMTSDAESVARLVTHLVNEVIPQAVPFPLANELRRVGREPRVALGTQSGGDTLKANLLRRLTSTSNAAWLLQAHGKWPRRSL